jgi:5-methylcytosine-specific restriction endonuclease McrA
MQRKIIHTITQEELDQYPKSPPPQYDSSLFRCQYCGSQEVSKYGFVCEGCKEKRDARKRMFHEERQKASERVRRAVKTNLRRARNAGTPATLTLDEWLSIIAMYNGLCSYCKKRPYEVLEHKIPIELGGGTTAENCVPACTSCNIAKGRRTELHRIPR